VIIELQTFFKEFSLFKVIKANQHLLLIDFKKYMVLLSINVPLHYT